LGIRYLLPVYPLLFIFVGRVVPFFASASVARAPARSLPKALLGIGVVWYVGAALWIHPDQLSYFNEAVGGPARGHLYLDDSNIDWGQDTRRLASYLADRGIPKIKLRPFPLSNPNYYRIAGQLVSDDEWGGDPSPGLYGFSTHLLVRGERFAQQTGRKTDWFSRYEPVDRIGYSIYLFQFE
ncbi:MAG: hypothetical protein O7J95_20035, partial [Planctomycetota bacterium]|nr:hypothetical protein [Planctomycetota bacterium]